MSTDPQPDVNTAAYADTLVTNFGPLSQTVISGGSHRWFTIKDAAKHYAIQGIAAISDADADGQRDAATLTILLISSTGIFPALESEQCVRYAFGVLLRLCRNEAGNLIMAGLCETEAQMKEVESYKRWGTSFDVPPSVPQSFSTFVQALKTASTDASARKTAIEAYLVSSAERAAALDAVKICWENPASNDWALYALSHLRLCSKDPSNFLRFLTGTGGAKLRGWAKLQSLPANETGIIGLSSCCQHIRTLALWPLCVMITENKGDADSFKKWVSSRWEYTGLAALSGMIKISQKAPVNVMVRQLITEGLVTEMLRMCATFYAYAARDPTALVEDGYLAKLLVKQGGCILTIDDQNLGRYCKLFSKEYLSWMGMYSGNALAARVVGAGACAVGSPLDLGRNDKVNSKEVDIGYTAMRLRMEEQVKDDKVATDLLKRAVAAQAAGSVAVPKTILGQSAAPAVVASAPPIGEKPRAAFSDTPSSLQNF